MKKYPATLAAIACALLALSGCSLGGDDTPSKTTTVHVDGPDADRKADDVVKAPTELVEKVERSDLADHAGARDETPKGVSPKVLKDAQEGRDYLRELVPPLPTAGASQGFPGCVTRFVGNQSARNGVRPQSIFDHYTVSPNRPGWSDVWAVVALFDRPSFSASSHFVIDREGHCAYIVPIERKAWTQAGSNSFAVSIEFVNSGSERTFLDTAGYAKAVAVHREIGRRTGIPMRRGAIRNCTPSRSGIVQHADGGNCSGGHTDIRPFSIDYLVKISAKGLVTGCASRRTRQIVGRLKYHRHRRNSRPKSSAAWRSENRHVADWKRAAQGRRAGLRARGRKVSAATAKRERLRCRTGVMTRAIGR